MDGEAGSGMQIWWKIGGIRRTRQGGNKCYMVVDELQPCASQVVYPLLPCTSSFHHEDPSEEASANKHGQYPDS